MFYATNQIKVKPEHSAKIEERFSQFHGLDQMAGFVSFKLLKQTWSMKKEQSFAEYVAVTKWESKQDFLDWVKSDAFKKAHENMQMEIFIEHPIPAGYEIVAQLNT